MKWFFILSEIIFRNTTTVSLFSFNYYNSHLIFVVAGFVEYSFVASFKQHQRHDGTIQKTFHR